ncbi:iron-containing redox enzyme family protein [Streptomyces sp. NPDC001941]|uniref:iron-containing redox enzyme family protein n=1 Tax=Streptomyces sp. NPDC001941 TaxID=3154659 RepID=UPI0033177AF3
MTTEKRAALPEERGVLSAAVVRRLRDDARLPSDDLAWSADPYGDDLQLALYLCYELHYRGFEGVDDAHEWDPALLAFRSRMEGRFLDALREELPASRSPHDVLADLFDPPGGSREGASGLAEHLAGAGTGRQVREYVVQRSLYHLKEADPHAWALPRLRGRAKAGLAAVEFAEYGSGRAERVHARLFARLMEDLGLDPSYGRYLDAACAPALACVNLITLLGLHRSLRGALVGHVAAVELTSPPDSRRLAEAMRRVGAGGAAARFYDEHLKDDAVREQVVRQSLVGGLLEQEPQLAADVVLGVEANALLERRLAAHLLTAWRAGASSLRRPEPGLLRAAG